MQTILLILTYAILIGAAGVHVLWALGVWWPVRDEAALARTVVGAPGITRMPPGWASGLVAFALLNAALILYGISNGSAMAPIWLLNLMGWGLVAVFGLRGLVSYVLPSLGVRMEEPFARLNLIFYSPLCLILALGFWSAL
ncbi:DUF3995 domain-containing protein [Aliiroseovarius sp. F20344]|uniref:DUF3995 domain-containing protein n=1 Tax=Aliiroseovarius sp. F20344 TaxID=2926414 RepID=UPI001FF504AE|nr:DUF3995 domain-containing protein [Aliiroseovarius sp. F20344]MCK0140926.1 DUF3995 domain-containing protein [Aliiroseovarius sp. F20344]